MYVRRYRIMLLHNDLTIVTRVIQRSSNELSIMVSVKFKQMETFNTYTFNSVA